MAQILQDPQVQQVLQQNGLSVDPASGNVVDQQSGQMLPPDQVQQILQELMQQQGGGAPAPGGEGQTPQDSGGGGQAAGQDPSQGAPQEQDPLTAILGKLDEILAALKGGAAPGGAAPAAGGENAPAGGAGAAPAAKKPSQSEKTDMMLSEIQRMNETLASLTGQQ